MAGLWTGVVFIGCWLFPATSVDQMTELNESNKKRPLTTFLKNNFKNKKEVKIALMEPTLMLSVPIFVPFMKSKYMILCN